MYLSTGSRWFRLDRHAGVRPTLPAALTAIMQNGMLDRTFQDALLPDFLYPALAMQEPWQGGLGDTKTFTRKGLLTPITTAITGSDASAATYAVEQWSVTMDQYGQSMDTSMLSSAMTLASKWLADVQTLGINAGQSINQLSRNKLFAAYSGGSTWCSTAGGSDTSLIVQSVDGFANVMVNGVLTPVSAGNPLSVTCNGVANTVTGVNVGTKTLTLGTARIDVQGDPIIASNAPTVIRPTGISTGFNLVAGSVATLALFRSAVARLRSMNVPTIGGYYTAHIDATTEQELFNDADFKQALQGRVDSPVWRDLSIGRFSGIDWVRNLEAPTVASGTGGSTVTAHRAIVLGANALVAAPFEGTGSLLAGADVEDVPSVRMVNVANTIEVALIVRPPQDRLQQTLSTTWSWIGDFGIPSDSLTGDAALYKRACVVEHA